MGVWSLNDLQLEKLERLRSEMPTAAPWLPILVIHIRSRVKTTQRNFARNYACAHLLKLLDKMYKYEMDPIRTEEATERTRDAGRTRTDGWTDGRSETNIPPNNFIV